MFNKKSLTLAVAAAATGLSMGSFAQIDVTADTGQVAIGNESITPTTTGVLPVGVGVTTGALNVQSELGIGVAANDQIFIRFDWTGATLLADLGVGDIDVAGVGSTGVTDGLTGDSSAIFGVLAGTSGFSQTAAVVLDLGTNGVALAGTSSDVRVRVFESQTNATNELLPLSDDSLSNAITLGDALSVTFADDDATAEVTTNFTEFTTGTTGTLGSFTASASTNFLLASTLTTAPLTGWVRTTASVVTYTGDFSFATSGTPYFVGSGGSCATVGAAVTVDTVAFATATSTVDAADSQPLCVTVNGTTETIPETSYSADVQLVHDVTTSSPNVSDFSGDIGDIDRNGTTVEVAYLTTFTDYNQRLLINSRHPVPAEYNITFQSEDGVTTTALGSASGTLQPGENLVLRAVDIVSITGGTRCSATVTVVAPEGNISVATTQVNLSDASTDTVSYN